MEHNTALNLTLNKVTLFFKGHRQGKTINQPLLVTAALIPFFP